MGYDSAQSQFNPSSGGKLAATHHSIDKIDRRHGAEKTTTELFVHSPLDYGKASIRLINVLPNLSSTGLIQCALRHSDLDDKYTCLSYEWGTDHDDNQITIDGKIFRVRRNLWDFLSMARKQYYSRPFWIDALCIDQDNILERNHQVKQMKQIFSQALGVVAWLGNDPKIAACLYDAREDRRETLPRKFYTLSYWRRAWITQEITLARSVTFVSGHEYLGMYKLMLYRSSALSKPSRRSRYTILSKSPTLDSPYVENLLKIGELKGQPVASLLHALGDMDCKIKRDRIFSLLGLCGEGSDLEPDYGISDVEVLVHTLYSHSKSLCFCTVAIIGKALELKNLPTMDQNSLYKEPIAEIQVTSRDKTPSVCSECMAELPINWNRKGVEGHVFCLQSVCDAVGGHVLFRIDLSDECLHEYCPRGHFETIKFLNGEDYPSQYSFRGIYLEGGTDSDTFGLQFSLGALLRMASFHYPTPLFEDHLWQTGSLQLRNPRPNLSFTQ